MSKRLTAEQVAEYMHDLAKVHASQHNNRNAETWIEAEMVVRRSLVETDEQRRERFERWCAKYDWDVERLRSGEYASGLTHDLWGTWQAALTWHCETEGGGA